MVLTRMLAIQTNVACTVVDAVAMHGTLLPMYHNTAGVLTCPLCCLVMMAGFRL